MGSVACRTGLRIGKQDDSREGAKTRSGITGLPFCLLRASAPSRETLHLLKVIMTYLNDQTEPDRRGRLRRSFRWLD